MCVGWVCMCVCVCRGRWDRGMFSAVIICIVDFL